MSIQHEFLVPFFRPQRESTGENGTCCPIISAGTALPSGLKRSLRCWSSRASYTVAFGYVAFSFFFFFFKTHPLGAGSLSNIHIPGITRYLVRRNERLSCIFLGSYTLPKMFFFWLIAVLPRTGPLPDDHLHLCRFTKISDAHDNQAACERALF